MQQVLHPPASHSHRIDPRESTRSLARPQQIFAFENRLQNPVRTSLPELIVDLYSHMLTITGMWLCSLKICAAHQILPLRYLHDRSHEFERSEGIF